MALAFLFGPSVNADVGTTEFWVNPERSGWLMKQGEVFSNWRRRWFVLKDGKIFWFKESHVTSMSQPRGVIPVQQCVSIKGAEDAINMPHAFEVEVSSDGSSRPMYFIADSDKEKEEWINAVGRAIVKFSKSITEKEVLDY